MGGDGGRKFECLPVNSSKNSSYYERKISVKKFDTSIFRQPASLLTKRLLVFVLGVFLTGVSMAFMVHSGFGTDPLSVFFTGVSNATGLGLGMGTNFIGIVMLIVIAILDLSYINIGTVISSLGLGSAVNVGFWLCGLIGPLELLSLKILLAVAGGLLLFVGIALSVTANAGIDVWSALNLYLAKKTGRSYRFFKVTVDILSMGVGFLLGGQVGYTTVAAAFLGGPIIQFFLGVFKKLFPYFETEEANPSSTASEG